MSCLLTLTFGERSTSEKGGREWEAVHYSFPFELSTDISGMPEHVSLPQGVKIAEWTCVKASLMLSHEDIDKGFRLSVLGEYDCCLTFSKNSISDNVMNGCSKNGRDDIFSGAYGPSALRLVWCENNGEEIKERDQLIIDVSVDVAPFRKAVIRSVADELSRLAPHALDDGHLGMNARLFCDELVAGGSSFSYPRFELNAVEDMVSRIEPELMVISRSPFCGVSEVPARIPVARVRKLTGRAVRSLAPDCLTCIHQGCLRSLYAKSKVASYSCSAHFAIKSFLHQVLRRIERIRSVATKERDVWLLDEQRYRRLIAGSAPAVKRDFEYNIGFKVKDCRRYVAEDDKVIEDSEKLQTRVMNCLRHEFLSVDGLQGSHVVDRRDFSYDAHYLSVYRLIKEYKALHHWWNPVDELDGVTHSFSGLQDDKFGSGLQRKYSMLFEYWAYWRLMLAFKSCGADFSQSLNDFWERLSRSIVVEDDYEKSRFGGSLGNLEIRIGHNYAAFSEHVTKKASFVVPCNSKHNYETPDICLIVRNIRTNRWFWITMDCKSASCLHLRDVGKQVRYLGERHPPDFSPNENPRPTASVLIYSGKNNRPAGLEGVEGEDVAQRNWEEDNLQKMKDTLANSISMNSKISRTAGMCVEPGEQVWGMIRANPVSSPIDAETSPFVDFAEIVLITARKCLG